MSISLFLQSPDFLLNELMNKVAVVAGMEAVPGQDMTPFLGRTSQLPVSISITLDFFSHRGGKYLSSLKQIYILDMDSSSLPVMLLPEPQSLESQNALPDIWQSTQPCISSGNSSLSREVQQWPCTHGNNWSTAVSITHKQLASLRGGMAYQRLTYSAKWKKTPCKDGFQPPRLQFMFEITDPHVSRN